MTADRVPTHYAAPVLTLAQALDIAADRDTRRRDAAPDAERVSYENDNPRWSGAPSLKQAIAWGRAGWPEGAAKIVRAAASVVCPDRAPDWRHDVAGVLPDVAAYCAGDPAHMLTPTHDDGDTGARRLATIYLPCWYSAGTSTDSINTIGAALVGMIDALEVNGTACAVVLHGSYTTDNHQKVMCHRITVKEHHDPLDVDRLAFCAACPAMMRRVLFALMEMDPNTRSATRAAYGLGMPPNTVPDVLDHGPGVIVLPSMGDPYWSRLGPVNAGNVRAILREECTAAGLMLPE